MKAKTYAIVKLEKRKQAAKVEGKYHHRSHASSLQMMPFLLS